MSAGSSFVSLPMCPELAKTIAQCLLKDENGMLRFDSSELSRLGATNAPRQRSDRLRRQRTRRAVDPITHR